MAYVDTPGRLGSGFSREILGSRACEIAQAIVVERSTKPCRLPLLLLCLGGALGPGIRAEVPAPLATAIQRWTAGRGDMAFTQETKRFRSDGGLKDDRVERFDPSLPDSRRWRLIEVNGVPA